MNVLCVFLVIFASGCGNRRHGMAGEGSGWTENRYFGFGVMSAIYSVILCKWHLIFFVLSWWNCNMWFFKDIWTALTKYHRLGGWGKLKFISHSFEAGDLSQGSCVVRWRPSSRSQVSLCILISWRGQQSFLPSLLYEYAILKSHSWELHYHDLSMTPFLTTSKCKFQLSSVQSLSRVWLFVTPWTTACHTSLSITNSQSLPKLMSVE